MSFSLKLRHSTGVRSSLTYAGLFAAYALVVTALVYWFVADYQKRQADAEVAAELAELTALAGRQGIDALAATVSARTSEATEASDEVYLLLDRNGRTLAGSLGATGYGAIAEEGDIPIQPAMGGEAHAIHLRATRLPGGERLIVGRDTHVGRESLELALGIFVAGSAAALLVAGVGGIVASRRMQRRVEAFARSTLAVMEGDMARRVPLLGREDDLDRLALAVNAMLERIQRLMENLQQVTDDIAHDLRKPLIHLRQRLEAMQRRSLAPHERPDAIDLALADIDSLLETFGAMLRISQIESGSRRAGFKPVDLRALLESVAETYAAVAEDHGDTLHLLLADAPRPVTGDAELITQMLVNLVENALCHCPRGTSIRLSLGAHGDGGAVVAVADDGPGVPVAERDKVFRRFYRLEPSRNRPGNGLGLSLVAAVAELHGVGIALEDNRPGLRAVLRFPPATSRRS